MSVARRGRGRGLRPGRSCGRVPVAGPSLLALITLLLTLATPGLPVHALDDLFGDSDRGIVEEDEAIGDATDPAYDDGSPGDGEDGDATGGTTPRPPAVVDIGALTTAPVRFSGSVDSGAGLSLGLSEWPGSSAAGDDDLRDLMNWKAGYDMSATMTVTARPRPYLRFSGSLKTALNENTARFSNPTVDSLFLDYTLHNTVFFRVGKYSLTWGQSRILPNIGNLVNDLSNGVGLRATVPAGPGTVTGLVYTRETEIKAHGSGDPRSFTYAGQFETTRGRLSTGLAAWLRAEASLRTTAYATVALGGLGLGSLDLTLEGISRLDRRDPWSEETRDFETLSQVVWEAGDPAWRVILEHSYNHSVVYGSGGFVDGARLGHKDTHRVGVGLRMPRFLPGDWRPEMQWRHAFEDDSGQVELLFSGNLAPGLEGNIGIPLKYGKPGTIYRGADTEIPENGVVSVLLAARLKFSF